MRCASCDTELAAGTLGGFCPVCLLDAPLPNEEFEDSFHYDLIEEIARGGMGVVYRATQHGSQRQVAVKMILSEQLATPGMMERFRAEVEAVASLEHSNILPVFETGESEGRPFYSMKFAGGGTLREHLREFREPRRAAELIATVARAVHHAHQRGILHRDLKPGNILLDGAEQTPYVADFGLAKWLGQENRLTIASTALGTPHYISPEQANGASTKLTTAADVYSLGAILYELLTGRPPFVADAPLEILRLVAQTTPLPPRDVAADVPRDLEVICLKCLTKDPAARYQSAAALAEDLERWLEGRTILARPSAPPERLWRWAKRNPALAALSAIVVALLVAVAIGSSIAAARLNVSNKRAIAAEHQAREELRSAALAEARATRQTGRMGQRLETLSALKKAAEVRPGADLRTEAFAALMLPDLKVERTWSDRHSSNAPAAFDSKLERYVVESDAGVLSLRRAADQTEIARLAVPEERPRVLYFAPFSADDSKVAARFADDRVRVYETETGKLLFELTARPVSSNARAFTYDFGFTPDSAELAVGLTTGGVSFHDSTNGIETGRLQTTTIPAVIAISHDGGKIALVAKKSSEVEIYDRASSRLEQTLRHPTHLFHVAWRPGTTQLVTSCNDDNLYLWDAVAGQQLRILQGHEGIPPLLAFHPNGRILASTSRDYSVRLWDVETGACLLNAHGLYGEPCLRFARDGHRLALGSEGARLSLATLVSDSPSREFFRCASGDWYSRISGMSVSPDGRLLSIALRSDGIHFFSARTGASLVDLPFSPNESKTACFTPGSDTLVASGPDGLTRRALQWTGNDKLTIGPAQIIDPRPNYLVTDVQGDPPVAALYNDKEGSFSLVRCAEPAPPVDLKVASKPAGAFLTPDARLAATNDWEGERKGESDVRVWNVRDGTLVRRLEAGPNNSVRISPSGKWLVACGSGAGAGLWSLPNLERGPKLSTAGDDAWFSPNEKFLAVLNNDNLDLVRIADGELLGSFPGDPSLAVAFGPQGDALFLGGNTRLYRWDLPALQAELRALGLDWDL
jgi:WD40 repeat protein/predicted Ser/Thr protein kinase